jgi:flagellin
MRLNHNLASLNIYREYSKNVKDQSRVLNRISSGYKVNSAAEDPNAVAQSEKLRIQIRGLQMASRNAQDGISMLQTAQGDLGSITSMLHRIKELTVQAGGAASASDKEIIQGEVNQLLEGINGIARNNDFNGVKLLHNPDVVDNMDPKQLFMASGPNVGEKINIPVFNLSSGAIGDLVNGKYLTDINVTASGGVSEALGIIDGALDMVLSVQSKYGALENRFERTFEITTVMGETAQRAESTIRDADLAEEMIAFARNSLLIEAGNAMMVQSNRFPQEILRILENMRR